MTKQNLRIIDVHHHILPDIYRDNLLEIGFGNSGNKIMKRWKPQDSLDLMDKYQIETGICSISEPALNPFVNADKKKAKELARSINEYMTELHEKYPTRFGGYALLPMPDVEASLEELTYALDVLHLDGVGLLSNYHDQYLGNTVFNEIFVELQKRKAVVYVHPSSAPKDMPRPEYVPVDYFQEFTFCTCRAAINLIYSGTMERCPDIKLIFSHMGGVLPYLRWRLNTCFLAARKNKTLSLSERVNEAWNSLNKEPQEYMKLYYYDTALSTHKVAFDAVNETAPGHILYGSDSYYAPEYYNELYLKEIGEYFTDSTELAAVCRTNAEKIFTRFKEIG